MYMEKTQKHGFLVPYLTTLAEQIGANVEFHFGNYLQQFMNTGSWDLVAENINANKYNAIFYGAANEIRINGCYCDYTEILHFTYHLMLLPPRAKAGGTFKIFDVYCITILSISLLSLIIVWKFYYGTSYAQSINDIVLLLQCSKTGLTTEIIKPKLTPKPKYLDDIADKNLPIVGGYHLGEHVLIGRSQYLREKFMKTQPWWSQTRKVWTSMIGFRCAVDDYEDTEQSNWDQFTKTRNT
ncbi:unnamed protein product [Acanthoscelides obtectus]|uniref:Uncharacterized protein n=1 Tax=Acanthoscelides obtectus TaxID=200917 RepID=A0A9P0Q3C2_ACAOB|nr:unnamed protein product [Acanthoscelides obtectus]CAK1638818.1 hypothetical protein AOBTE_LOCUS10833 [Acanthoscelides obtectus]